MGTWILRVCALWKAVNQGYQRRGPDYCCGNLCLGHMKVVRSLVCAERMLFMFLNPKPQSLNTKPSTLNPKPQTLNPKS